MTEVAFYLATKYFMNHISVVLKEFYERMLRTLHQELEKGTITEQEYAQQTDAILDLLLANQTSIDKHKKEENHDSEN